MGMRHSQGEKDGTEPAPMPKLLLIDLDDPAAGGMRISGEELCALQKAHASGIAISVITAYRPDSCPAELAIDPTPSCTARPRPPAQPAAVPVTIISCRGYAEAASSPNAFTLTDEMARVAARCGLSFSEVAVIASCPQDTPCALEAGYVCALRGAGEACEAIADAVFPARREGGLVQALEHITARRTASRPGGDAANSRSDADERQPPQLYSLAEG